MPTSQLLIFYAVSVDTLNLTISLIQDLSLWPGPRFSYGSVICVYRYKKTIARTS